MRHFVSRKFKVLWAKFLLKAINYTLFKITSIDCPFLYDYLYTSAHEKLDDRIFSSTGIPELNISSLDPFFLDEYLLHYDSGDISGKCLYKNVYTSGLMNIKITDVRYVKVSRKRTKSFSEQGAQKLSFRRSEIDDPDYFEMEIDFYFPKVISTGNYKAEGIIGNFPIQGKGIFNVTACKYNDNP